jgi:hypothetical protein
VTPRRTLARGVTGITRHSTRLTRRKYCRDRREDALSRAATYSGRSENRISLTNRDDMLEHIKAAAAKIDWRFVRLSRLHYAKGVEPVGLCDPHWLERPFAYELYQQIRCRIDDGEFDMECLVQAEVLKTYQAIRDLEKMPDLLFHVPDSTTNLAVVEVKLASNPSKSLHADLKKLALFKRVLGYETLVEVVVGTAAELSETETEFEAKIAADAATGTPIDLLLVEFGSAEVRHRRFHLELS